jgi:hypothetical protein
MGHRNSSSALSSASLSACTVLLVGQPGLIPDLEIHPR